MVKGNKNRRIGPNKSNSRAATYQITKRNNKPVILQTTTTTYPLSSKIPQNNVNDDKLDIDNTTGPSTLPRIDILTTTKTTNRNHCTDTNISDINNCHGTIQHILTIGGIDNNACIHTTNQNSKILLCDVNPNDINRQEQKQNDFANDLDDEYAPTTATVKFNVEERTENDDHNVPFQLSIPTNNIGNNWHGMGQQSTKQQISAKPNKPIIRGDPVYTAKSQYHVIDRSPENHISNYNAPINRIISRINETDDEDDEENYENCQSDHRTDHRPNIISRTSTEHGDHNDHQTNDNKLKFCKENDSPDSGIEVIIDADELNTPINSLVNDNRNYCSASEQCSANVTNAFKKVKSEDESVNNISYSKVFQAAPTDSAASVRGNNDHEHAKLIDEQICLPDLVESTTTGTGTSEHKMVVSTDVESNGYQTIERHKTPEMSSTDEMKDLVNNESKFSTKLDDAEKQVIASEFKVADLTYKLNELERNLTVKTWDIDRLKAELSAAYKEGECVRQKLKLQDVEMDALRTKLTETEDTLNRRYDELQIKQDELHEKLIQTQELAGSLQLQLAEAQCNVTDLQKEKDSLLAERLTENEKFQLALDKSCEEKTEIEQKWHQEFEKLRTVNSDREEHLLQDCEWKLRSTEKNCKEKVEAAIKSKNDALTKAQEIEEDAKKQINEVRHLKSHSAEVTQLRGLTNEQSSSIKSLMTQIDDLKLELVDANQRVDESLESVRRMKVQYIQDMSEKDRQMVHKVDEARGEVAVMWEDRLLEEMGRLKIELETCYAEDRAEALTQAQDECRQEIVDLKSQFENKEKQLLAEIESLKQLLTERNAKLEEANNKADEQIMQIRLILDRAEREHTREMDAEIAKREELLESLRKEHEDETNNMQEQFCDRLQDVKDEFATEINASAETLQAKHAKQMEQQYEKMAAEREDTIQHMERTYKRKLVDADTRLRDVEIVHERAIKDIQTAHAMERSSLEQRDQQNSNEIETLHRKCRCLTKLFEEMRMRYERRDPRPEDVREIQELRCRVDSQDRDLRRLTEILRELQMDLDHRNGDDRFVQNKKQRKLTNTNCDVIYEENEECESPPSIATV